MFAFLLLSAGWLASNLAPTARELGSVSDGDEHERLRQHVANYASEHWGLEIETPSDDIVLLTSPPWTVRTSSFSLDHYIVIARGRLEEGAADIFRFDVSTAPSTGVPVRCGFLRRLTSTPEVDERSLVASGARVAFSQYHRGRYDGLVILDFSGQPVEQTAAWSRTSQLLDALRNLQQVGQLRGIGRTQLTFDYPPFELALVLGSDGAVMIERQPGETFELDFGSLETSLALVGDVSAHYFEKVQDPVLLVTVDLVRNLPFVGPDRMTVIQRVVYDLIDTMRQQQLLGSEVLEEDDDQFVSLPPPIELPPGEGLGLLFGQERSRNRFPPDPVETLLRHPRRSEGQWVPVEETLVAAPDGVPLFYETYLRVDEEREYARVYITAWDPERVRLGIVAGTEEPVPRTSGFGTGRIPREGGQVRRLVGAFNGGFQSVHGATFGMVEQRGVLIPPRSRLATVATLEGDRVALGRWSDEYELPDDLIGLRQNLRPLVEDFAVNPDRAQRWGWALGQRRDDLGSPLTTRSGLCRLGNGGLAYFYGRSIDGQALGRVMGAANCDFGVHLDLNPHHTGFEYYRVEDEQGDVFEAREMRRTMHLTRHPRYIGTDNRDFFYLIRRPTLIDDSLPDPCGGDEALHYQRLTSTGTPLDPGRALLLNAAVAVGLTDHPLCDDPEVAVDVVRIPATSIRARIRYYRETPDEETLSADRGAIAIPAESREASNAVGVDSRGNLLLGGQGTEFVPAVRLNTGEEPPEEPGVLVGLDSDETFYLVGSQSSAAAAATLARLDLDVVYWIPGPSVGGPAELHFDDGTARAFPRSRERTGLVGFVLWLDLVAPYHELSFRLQDRVGE
jgi:hypothetical protein